MTTDNQPAEQKSYELKIRILGNEVFAIGVASSSDNNKWILIGLVSMFSLITVLGAYGEKIISLWRLLVA